MQYVMYPNNDMMSGMGGNTSGPNETTACGMIVTILMRFCESIAA